MARKLWNIFTTAFVVLAVLLAVLLVGVRLAGLEVYTVLSPSMQESYPVGSVVYVQKTDPQDLQVGDAISFMANETTVVTHRIVEIVPDEVDADTLWFRTKGDSNATPDAAPVHHRNVIGKVVFSIPLLGFVTSYIQQPPGLYVAAGVTLVLLVLVCWPKKSKKSNDDPSIAPAEEADAPSAQDDPVTPDTPTLG